MGKGKGYRLEKGFLLDYGWVPSLKRLSGEQFKALVLALLSYQQSEGRETLPDWGEDVMMSCIAEMILPQLRNRLLGAVRQAAGKEENKETAEVKREATPLAAEPEKGTARTAAATVAGKRAETRSCPPPPPAAESAEAASSPAAAKGVEGHHAEEISSVEAAGPIEAVSVTPTVAAQPAPLEAPPSLPEAPPLSEEPAEPEDAHAYDTLAAWGLLREEGDDFWAQAKPRGRHDTASRAGSGRR